jgi:hypothetical protein
VGALFLLLLGWGSRCFSVASLGCGAWQLANPFPPFTVQWMLAFLFAMAALSFFVMTRVVDLYSVLDPTDTN